MPGADKRTILQGKTLEKDKKAKTKSKPPVLSPTAQLMAKQLFPAKRRLMKVNRDKTVYPAPSSPGLVYTTATDCLFQKAGFPSSQLCCVAGDVLHWQCSQPCLPQRHELDPHFRFSVTPSLTCPRLVPHNALLRQLLSDATLTHPIDTTDANSTLAVCEYCRTHAWTHPLALPPVLPEAPVPPHLLAELDHRLYSYPGVMEAHAPFPAAIGEVIQCPDPLTLPEAFSGEDEQREEMLAQTRPFTATLTQRHTHSTDAQNVYADPISVTQHNIPSALTLPPRPATARLHISDAPLRERILTADRTARAHTAHTGYTEIANNNIAHSNTEDIHTRSPSPRDTLSYTLDSLPLHSPLHASSPVLSLRTHTETADSSSSIQHSSQLPTASVWTARQSLLSTLAQTPPQQLGELPFRTVSTYAPAQDSPTFRSLSPRNTQRTSTASLPPYTLSQSPGSEKFGMVVAEGRTNTLNESDEEDLDVYLDEDEDEDEVNVTQSLARLLPNGHSSTQKQNAIYAHTQTTPIDSAMPSHTTKDSSSYNYSSSDENIPDGRGSISARDNIDDSVRREYLGAARIASDSSLYTVQSSLTQTEPPKAPLLPLVCFLFHSYFIY